MLPGSVPREQDGGHNGLPKRYQFYGTAARTIKDRPIGQTDRIDKRDPTEADPLLVHLDKSASDGKELKNIE